MVSALPARVPEDIRIHEVTADTAILREGRFRWIKAKRRDGSGGEREG